MSRAGRKMLPVLVLVMLATQCAPLLREPFACDGVQLISRELTLAQAEAYCHYAVRERQKVAEYWGPTWTAPIRIHVSSEYRISRALVPAYQGNRGFLEMPARRVGDGTSALLHEIVHSYAPHGNRFLAEGLAVYLHTKLAGNPAFPNFGADLNRLAARDLPGVETVQALNDVRTPRASRLPPSRGVALEPAGVTQRGRPDPDAVKRPAAPMKRRSAATTVPPSPSRRPRPRRAVSRRRDSRNLARMPLSTSFNSPESWLARSSGVSRATGRVS